MGGQWFRSWLSVDKEVVIYEAMTPECGSSVVQVLVVTPGYYLQHAFKSKYYESLVSECARFVSHKQHNLQ